jgi:prepilin peptidase CpaA
LTHLPNGAVSGAVEAASPVDPRRQLAWLAALLAPAILGPVWVLTVGRLLPGRLPGTLAGFVAVALLLTCSATDLRWHKIPNWATYPAFLWAVLLNGLVLLTDGPAAAENGTASAGWSWLGAVGLGQSVAGAAVCFVIMFFVYQLAGGSGAADVKLATALGALSGIEEGIAILICTYIVAAIVMLSWTIWTVGPMHLAGALSRRIGAFLLPFWVAPPTTDQEELLHRKVPLALFFTLGTVLVWTGWPQSW